MKTGNGKTGRPIGFDKDGAPGFATYSKAALVSFVRSWTAELASRGIRANVISPGPAETPTPTIEAGGKAAAEASRDYFRKMVHMEPLGTPDEIASACQLIAAPFPDNLAALYATFSASARNSSYGPLKSSIAPSAKLQMREATSSITS